MNGVGAGIDSRNERWVSSGHPQAASLSDRKTMHPVVRAEDGAGFIDDGPRPDAVTRALCDEVGVRIRAAADKAKLLALSLVRTWQTAAQRFCAHLLFRGDAQRTDEPL